MDFKFCGPNFRTRRWNSDMWQAIQLHCFEQSCNRSPWENDHKYQLVKPILMKPMVLDERHASYLNTKFPRQRNSNFRDTIETVTGISTEEIRKLGLPVLGASLHCFQKRSTLDISTWGAYFYPIISKRFQVSKIRVSLKNPRSSRSRTRTDTSNR